MWGVDGMGGVDGRARAALLNMGAAQEGRVLSVAMRPYCRSGRTSVRIRRGSRGFSFINQIDEYSCAIALNYFDD